MILVGYLAKEFIRWQKNGRSAHIFNPSSFPLAVFSVALIVTRTTDITFGQAIATTQFYPPHMYWAIFLVTLPAQLLFGVARMTLAAVVSLYAFSLAFFAATGTYFFYDSHIPLPVFLGMHLLFTDPSTSPRSELGRIWFGVIYAAGTAFLYWALGAVGIPTFYDKLLPVPDHEPHGAAHRRAGGLGVDEAPGPGPYRHGAHAPAAARGLHAGLGGRLPGHELRAGGR